ncbi:MAG: hypothetical protein AB1730_19490 [Myxococcota bacterium]
MRSLLSSFAVLSLSLFATACGSPKAGDKCDTTGFLCESAQSAMECKLGVWVSLPCKGPGGCVREGDTVKCDMSGNMEGDACASSAAGKGLCSGMTATLECREDMNGNLVLTKTNDCRTCTVTGDQVICQP